MGKPGLVMGVLAAVLAAAGAIYYVGFSGPAAEAPPATADADADAAATPDAAGATLHGRARPPPTVASLALALTVRGRVLDAAGGGVEGVPVAARRSGPSSSAGRAPSDDMRPEAGFTKAIATLDTPKVGRTKPDAETKSGAGGQYELRLAETGRYQVYAEAPPPLVGSNESASLTAGSPSAEINLTVKRGSRLAGRVVDASDHGVEAVISGWWDAGAIAGAQGWTTAPVRTDKASGDFSFDAVPDGKGHLWVHLAGRATLYGTDVKTPHEGVVVIRIGAGGVVKGRVLDSEGRGVASADLTVTTSGGGGGASASEAPTSGTFRAKSIADGAYRIEGVIVGKVERIAALASGYVLYESAPPRASWSGATVTEAAETTIDIPLLRGGRLEGRVVESGTGAGVPEATVLLFRTDMASNTNGQPLSATSDTSGHYAIEGVAIGKWVVMAESASHYLPALQMPSDPMKVRPQDTTPPISLLFVLTKENETVHRDIEMKRGVPAAGRVVGPDGGPVAAARVRSTRYQNPAIYSWGGGVGSFAGRPQELATTGDDGAFSIAGLPPQESCALVAVKEGLVGVPCEPFRVAVGAAIPPLTLKMTVGGTLAGRALDEEGKPVAGAMVTFSVQGGMRGLEMPNTQTAPDGGFQFVGVPEGRINLSAYAVGFGQVQVPVEAMGPGEKREGVEIRFMHGATLSGIVVDSDGKPVAKRPLWARAVDGRQGGFGQGTTAEDGTFSLGGLSPGKVRIAVSPSRGQGGQIDAAEEYEAPGTGIRIVIPVRKTTVVWGRVTDAAGGAIPLCQVTVKPASSPTPPGGVQIPTPVAPGRSASVEEAVNGEFRIEVQGEPPFIVTAALPRDGNAMPMNLKSGTATVADPAAGPVVVVLESGLEIRGHVIGPEGTPVEDVDVAIGAFSMRTDAKGSFRAGGLDAGELIVSVSITGSLIAPPPMKVKAGTLDVIMKMTAGSVIAGVVLGPDDKPFVNCQMQALWKAQGSIPQGQSQGSVGADGRFRIEPIPDVPAVTLNVRPYGVPQRRQVPGSPIIDVPQPVVLENIRPGTVDLVVRLLPGATISGRVVSPTGEGVPEVQLNAQPADPVSGAPVPSPMGASYGRTDADGAFAITGLSPGTYNVSGQGTSQVYAVEPVKVEAPARGVRIEAVKTGSITGRIEGDGDLSRFLVRLISPGQAGVFRQVSTDSTGSFRIDGIGGGLYALAASKPGDDRYGLAADVKAGASNLVIRLAPGLAIEGTLEDASGAPVTERSRVWVVAPTWFAQAGVGELTGHFRISGLPPGRYKLYGVRSSGSDSGRLENIDGGATGLHLRLP